MGLYSTLNFAQKEISTADRIVIELYVKMLTLTSVFARQYESKSSLNFEILMNYWKSEFSVELIENQNKIELNEALLRLRRRICRVYCYCLYRRRPSESNIQQFEAAFKNSVSADDQFQVIILMLKEGTLSLEETIFELKFK